MSVSLRWYQQEAVDAAWSYWSRGGGNPLIELPTGAGKSLLIGEICRRLREKDARVLVATHRSKLLTQDEKAILALYNRPFEVGVYSAGLNRREIRAVTVAGVQSVAKRARQLGHVDVMIVDEAHLVPPSKGGQYARLIGALLDINPDMRIVGLTATPYRIGQGLLTEGDDAIFDSIVYTAPMARLIEEGYLAPMITRTTSTEIDTRGLRTERGDFVAADLEMAADVDAITDAVADDIARSGRKHALVFGVSVAHASRLRNAIRIRGIACESVTGETKDAERIYKAFERGEIGCITSCDVMTTGFDAPLVDLVALVRPTQSAALYVQMTGRGARVCEGKTDCLVLDYGGNIARHGPVDAVKVVPKASRGDGEAPYKICPECKACCPTSTRACRECDYEFPPPERKANERASRLAVLSGNAETKTPPRRHVVDNVGYHAHISKASGNLTLRCDYVGSGERLYEHIASEYVCIEHKSHERTKAEQWLAEHGGNMPVPDTVKRALEHKGYARIKAEKWWAEHGGQMPVPDTVEEALEREGELLPPVAVWTQPDGKYVRVTKCEFGTRKDIAESDARSEEPEEQYGVVYELEEDELPF
jgi:DNA repair protein RadD